MKMKNTCCFFLSIAFIFSVSDINAQYITTIAGNGATSFSGDGGPAILAEVFHPSGVAMDTAGNIYIGDSRNNRVRKITPDGIITTIAGGGTGYYNGAPATAVSIGAVGVAADRHGNVYIGDGSDNWVLIVSPAGIINTYAGTGTLGHTGDGGPATAAELWGCYNIALDSIGNLYIDDEENDRIRKVNTAGIITTIAGTGVAGYGGDGGPATTALIYPTAVAVDKSGNIFIAETENNRVRKVNAMGIITTFAGNGVYAYSGDGGPATAAELGNIQYVAADKYGNVYITCGQTLANDYIREVDTLGIITTIAGIGTSAFSGDGGPATAAGLYIPCGIVVSPANNIYFADESNNRIREITTRPYFTRGDMQEVTFCNDTLNVDTLLAAYDTNSGNTEMWALVYGPFHGSASVADTAISTGNLIIPSGLTYTPVPGFAGVDTFRVVIADGLISDTTTIYLVVQEPASAGAITGPDTVCKSRSITLADTASGGVWSSSNTNVLVLGSGNVLGTSAGIDTLSYTVTNSCGAVTATYIVAVKACTNEVNNVTASNAISIFPNPGDGTFTITFSSPVNGQAQVVVTNLMGEKVASPQPSPRGEGDVTQHIDVSGLPAGVYFVGVVTNEGMYNTKVVVVR